MIWFGLTSKGLAVLKDVSVLRESKSKEQKSEKQRRENTKAKSEIQAYVDVDVNVGDRKSSLRKQVGTSAQSSRVEGTGDEMSERTLLDPTLKTWTGGFLTLRSLNVPELETLRNLG